MDKAVEAARRAFEATPYTDHTIDWPMKAALAAAYEADAERLEERAKTEWRGSRYLAGVAKYLRARAAELRGEG